MKTKILLYFLLCTAAISQAQNCFWGKVAGDNNDNFGKSITTDASGNVYSTGYFFSDTMRFGNIILTNPIFGSIPDIFIVKHDVSGNAIWARSFGSDLDDQALGITADANANIFITGFFRGDSITFGNTTLYNPYIGSACFILVKLDSAGNVSWAKKASGANSDDIGAGVTVDASGNIYVTGRFHSDSLSFDNITIHNHDLAGASFDIFTVKYNAAGNAVWAISAGNTYLWEYGNGIAADNNANVFVTGYFESDTLFFGSDTLVSNINGTEKIFLAKLDSSGNVDWIRFAGAQNNPSKAYAVATDGTNAYITGYFTGTSISFGAITITSSASSGEMFFAKYDAAGNCVMAKSAAGNSSDQGYGIAARASGEFYITGTFNSDTIVFDGIQILHPTQSINGFAVKYNSAGIALWANEMGDDVRAVGVAVDAADNVYFTGYVLSNTLNIENVILSNPATSGYFIAHPYQFSASLTSTNVSCNGASDGTAAIVLSGGTSPFIYTWSTGETSQSISGLPAGYYSGTVGDANQCYRTVSDTISEPPADSAKICMVTVDSLSMYNIIVWEKAGLTTVDSFIVYREITTGNYMPIASIPFDSLSEFVDTVRTLYFPNTGDPNAGTYRYKIQAHDTCGNYSLMSPYHNTIYFINNNGTFFWQQLYTIENDTNPVVSYILLRDDSSNGNWHSVSSVAGTQQTVSDPLYSVYQNIASWRVETQWAITCTPTRSSGYSSSLSNVYSSSSVGVNELTHDGAISVFPNPATGKIFIRCNGEKIESARVYNVLGELLDVVEQPRNNEMDLSLLTSGIYFLRLSTGQQTNVIKFVKE